MSEMAFDSRDRRLNTIRKHILSDSYIEAVLGSSQVTGLDIRIKPKKVDTESTIFVCKQEFDNIASQHNHLLRLNLANLFMHNLTDLPLYVQFYGDVYDLGGQNTQAGYLLYPINSVDISQTISNELLNVLLLLQDRIFCWPDWDFYGSFNILDFNAVENKIPRKGNNLLNMQYDCLYQDVYTELQNEYNQIFNGCSAPTFQQIVSKSNMKLPDDACMLNIAKHTASGKNRDSYGANSRLSGSLFWGCIDIQHKG